MPVQAKSIQHTRVYDFNIPVEITYDEAQDLLKIAAAEGGNQGVYGQLLIMIVIMNRVRSSEFPNSISEVIRQDGQFESVTNGMFNVAEPTADTHLALAELEKGKLEYRDIDYIGFETTENHGALSKYFEFAETVGDHDFYRFK